VSTRMGSEFIPTLDEGDIALHACAFGNQFMQAVEMQHTLEKKLIYVPEVERVFARSARRVATDPMPPSVQTR